jgi:hypothetical protein
VLDLDGRDPGWVTVGEKLGVERWRGAPDTGERILSAIGSTVAGRPLGSDRVDVESVTLLPGRAPTFGAVPDRPVDAAPPSYAEPRAPEYAPPRQPDTTYPGANTGVIAAGLGGAPTVIEGVGGGVLADQGSFARFDIVLQENADGRVRALYKRVYVGTDDAGRPYADSVWVTGPEPNDVVPINYSR